MYPNQAGTELSAQVSVVLMERRETTSQFKDSNHRGSAGAHGIKFRDLLKHYVFFRAV